MPKLVFRLQPKFTLHVHTHHKTILSYFFPPAVSQITSRSPVPSPQSAELLQLNFSQKDSLQEAIQHDFFKLKVNVSNFSKCNQSYFEFSWTFTDGPIDKAATSLQTWIQTINILSKDSRSQNSVEETKVQPLCNSHTLLCHTGSRKGMG